jgi:hypothetical protein
MRAEKSRELVEIALKEAEAYYRQQGTALTLRGLFYILVSKNVIPNTVYSYQKLSRVLAQARYRGEFPWSLLKDTTRRSIHMESLTYFQTKPLTPEEIKKFIERFIENYYDFSINPWENQKHRVVVALEKEALADAVSKFISFQFFPSCCRGLGSLAPYKPFFSELRSSRKLTRTAFRRM